MHWRRFSVAMVMALCQACGGGGSGLAPANQPPVAAFDASGQMMTGLPIRLDAGLSSDPEGQLLQFAWQLLVRPAGSAAALTASVESIASLIPDAVGDYRLRLTVTDAHGLTATAEKLISVVERVNRQPTISAFTASPDSLAAGGLVRFDWSVTDLDGDAVQCSFDPVGDGLTVLTGDCAVVAGRTQVYSTPGLYRPRLMVIDGLGGRAVIDRIVTVTGGSTSVVLIEPAEEAVVGLSPQVKLRITASKNISSALVRLLDRTAALVVVPPANCTTSCVADFAGMLDLAGVASGRQLLDVTVNTDGELPIRLLRPVFVDFAPTLTVNEPVEGSVASPHLKLSGSCQDEVAQTCSIKVFNGETPLASQSGVLDQTLDMSAYLGRTLQLTFVATDARNQTTRLTRNVHVDNSARLTTVLSLPGPVLDVAGDRVLYRISTADGETLGIHDRASGLDEQVPLPGGRQITAAYLTPVGTMMVTSQLGGNVLSSRVHDWNRGSLLDLGMPNSARSLVVKGRYASWSVGSSLLLRDVDARTQRTVTTSAGNTDNGLAANGAIAWWGSGYQIFLDDGATRRQLTNSSPEWNTYVLTDGRQVVYRKHTPCCTNQVYAIAMHDGVRETILRPAAAPEPSPGRDFQVRDGWVAYTDLGGFGQAQVWTRDSQGTLRRRTETAAGFIETLGDQGQLMLVTGGRRYFSPAAGALQEIGSDLGTSYFENGVWYVVIGRNLYRASPL